MVKSRCCDEVSRQWHRDNRCLYLFLATQLSQFIGKTRIKYGRLLSLSFADEPQGSFLKYLAYLVGKLNRRLTQSRVCHWPRPCNFVTIAPHETYKANSLHLIFIDKPSFPEKIRDLMADIWPLNHLSTSRSPHLMSRLVQSKQGLRPSSWGNLNDMWEEARRSLPAMKSSSSADLTETRKDSCSLQILDAVHHDAGVEKS